MAYGFPDEFEQNEHAKQGFPNQIDGLVRFDLFQNRIFFDAEEKIFSILVDNRFEEEPLFELISQKEKISGPESDKPKSGNAENKPLNPYSGQRLTFSLGEGIIEFCRYDFKNNEQAFHFPIQYFSGEIFMGIPNEPIAKLQEKLKALDLTDSLSIEAQTIMNQFEHYANTMMADRFFNSTYYTAIFPPDIPQINKKSVINYLYYIYSLQNEYDELLEFCFDVNFYPEILESLTAAERYFLYCKTHNRSLISKRTEQFKISSREMCAAKMPYGCTKEELVARVNTFNPKVTSKTQTVFENKYGLPLGYMNYAKAHPYFINVEYICSNLADMLSLEVSKMLEYGIRIKKCKNCGQFFVLKGNYQTEYCDRIPEGEARSCQVIASLNKYQKKVGTNEAWKAYNKYYKRYFARVKAGTVPEQDFKRWKAEAVAKRNNCSKNTIELASFIEWMENSFLRK